MRGTLGECGLAHCFIMGKGSLRYFGRALMLLNKVCPDCFLSLNRNLSRLLQWWLDLIDDRVTADFGKSVDAVSYGCHLWRLSV